MPAALPSFVSGRPADLVASVAAIATSRLSLLPTVLIAIGSAGLALFALD